MRNVSGKEASLYKIQFLLYMYSYLFLSLSIFIDRSYSNKHLNNCLNIL